MLNVWAPVQVKSQVSYGYNKQDLLHAIQAA